MKPARALLVAAVLVAALLSACYKPPVRATSVGNSTPEPGFGAPPAVPFVRPPLPPGWVEFKHPDCNLSVYTPGGFAVPDSLNSPQSLGERPPPGQMYRKSFSSIGRPLWCEVYTKHNGSTVSDDARRVPLLATFDFKENVTSREVQWAGLSAVEITASRPQAGNVLQANLMVSRRMWIGDYFYNLTLYGIEGHPTATEQAAFFDSFKLGN